MINFFCISTVWFWVSHTGQEIHLQFCTGKHKPISSSPSTPALGITWSSWLAKIMCFISSKHLSSSLKASNRYLALCWRARSTQCPHLSPSTAKNQPALLIKRHLKPLSCLSSVHPSRPLHPVSLKHTNPSCSPQKVAEETSEAWGDRFKSGEQSLVCSPLKPRGMLRVFREKQSQGWVRTKAGLLSTVLPTQHC